jgi:hypothetical protein
MKPATKTLVRLAKAAASAHAKATAANARWVAAFRDEYGHDDISDLLVEVIDYNTGGTDILTSKYIGDNSRAGQS